MREVLADRNSSRGKLKMESKLQIKFEELTDSEKIRYNTSEIGKIVKKQIHNAWKGVKLSVTAEYYAGGSTLHVSIMEAPFRMFRTWDELSFEEQWKNCGSDYDLERKKQNYNHTFQKQYDQVNHFYFKECPLYTDKAKVLLNDIQTLINHFNFDHSDAMIDYFHVNFYSHLEIGKWDKPFKQIGGAQ